MKKILILFLLFLSLAAVFVLWQRNKSQGEYLEKQIHYMMDTYVTIHALGPKEVTAKAIDLALDRLQEIDVKFNQLNPKSPVYAFNQNNEAITDPEIIGLLRLAQEVSRKYDGAFDITVEPLVELWGFYSKSYCIPKAEQIKDALTKVGYQHLRMDNTKLEKDDVGVKIDLGGIAKGYALGQAAKVLKAQGVTSALIDIGGDIYALGKKGARLWKVGIKDPRHDGILGYVQVQDTAVVGSGDYERFFIKDGKRYHHIFNPKTGYPAQGAVSVTLIYPDPVLAQAWAKIPFVLGPEKGLELFGQIPGIEAMIITASGERFSSLGLRRAFKIMPN